MSTTGRLQDALCDALWGYEDGNGKFYPGSLHDLGWERVSAIVDEVVDITIVVRASGVPSPETEETRNVVT